MMRLTILAAISLALYGSLLAVGSWGQEFTRFAATQAGLFALWGAAAWVALRGPALSFRALVLVGIAAAAFRAVVLFAPPTLSDDLYRYVWDGRVLLSGVNPYRHAPTAPELEPLRDALWPLINHPTLLTIYPPVLQAVFAGAAAIAPTVFFFKLVMGTIDLAAGFVLLLALRAAGRRPQEAILYLWNPLVVVEFAGQGHADAVGIFLLAVALRAWVARRPFAAGAALTLAGMVKFLPWAALPLFVRPLRARWLLLPAIAAACYAPFLLGGVNPLGSLTTYAATWRGNDFLFGLLAGGGEPTAGALRTARLLGLGIAAAAWGTAALARRPWPVVLSWSLGALLLVSPVVHPWYVAWLLPLALVARHPAWWIWSATAVLAYHPLPGYLSGGAWTETGWVKGVEYAPVLALAGWQLARELRRGRAAAPPPCDV